MKNKVAKKLTKIMKYDDKKMPEWSQKSYVFKLFEKR